MRIGISFGMAMLSYRETLRASRELDDVFSSIWIPDSQYLYRDCYALLSGVAASTRRAALGTLLTTPVTRHPTVIAAAAATIEELAPGRMTLGLGTGDSAVRRIGLRPARLRELERAIEEIRGFCADRRSSGDPPGPDWPAPSFPIHVVASGDRTLELAFRVADGLVLSVGAAAGLVRTRLSLARMHRPHGFPVRSFNYVSICDDERTAIARLKPSVTWFGINHPALVEEAGLPRTADITARLAEFQADYAQFDLVHSQDWDRAMELAAFVPDEWVHAFGIAGTARHFTDRVKELQAIGVDEVIVRAPCAALWRETAERVRDAVTKT